MAGRRDIQAGRAHVSMYVRDAALVRGLRNAQRRLHAFGSGAQAIGTKMIRMGALMAAPFAFAARTFMGFEDQMLTVKAVAGAVGDEFDRLTEKAKFLGRTTSYTAAEVAGGMVELGRAGFKPAEIDASIGSILNLARATGTELPKAAEIAAGTLRAFNLEADQMSRVTDVMVATANNSAQTLEQLGDSMTYVAPIASEYGLTLEETSKALGVMANMQIKGSMAGTSMRMMLLQLSDPGIRKQLQDMDVDLSNFGDTMIGAGRIMADMSGPKRLDFAKQIFGQRAAGGALKLAKGGFDDLSNAIDNAGNTAAKTAAEMDSGFGGVFRRLMSALEGTRIALGKAIDETLGNAMETITKTTGALTEFINENKKTVVAVLATAVGVIGLGAVLASLGFVVLGVSAAVGALTTAFVFLLAHPVVVAFTYTTLAAIAFGIVLKKVLGLTAELSDAYEKLTASHDELRKADIEHMTRLDALSKKEKLSNEEKKEAVGLIAALEGRYGKLGVILNDFTGTVDGMGEAWARFNEAIRAGAIVDLEAQMADLSEQMEDVNREMAFASVGSVLYWNSKAAENKAVEKSILLAEKMRKVRERLTNLRAGEVSALTGEKLPPSLTTPDGASSLDVAAEEMSAEEYASINARLIERLRRMRIESMEDEHARAIALINHRYDTELAKAKYTGLQIATIEETREREIANVDADFRSRKAKEEEWAAKNKAYAEKRLSMDLERAQINATQRGKKKKEALLELEKKEAMQRARKLGLNEADVEQLYALKGRALGGAAALGGTAVGTFSAAQSALMGGGGIQSRILKVAERQLKQAEMLVEIDKKQLRAMKMTQPQATA